MKTKIITSLAICMAVVLAFAATTTFTYAEGTFLSNSEAEVKITVLSDLGISVNATQSSASIPVNSYNDGTNTTNRVQHEISVVANAAYKVTIEDKDDDTNLRNGDNVIPTVATNNTSLAAGTPRWGWQTIATADAASSNLWNPVPAANSAATVKSGSTATTGTEKVYVRFGIATSDTLVAGDYKDTVVYRISAAS